MRHSHRFLALTGLLVSNAASAAWPDDITLSQIGEWNGVTDRNTATTVATYERVVRQLAVGISNKPTAPARTLGMNGFNVAFTSSIGFIDASTSDPYNPSPWQRADEDGDPSPTLWIPGITVRKGLPFSFEAGANMGYIAFSRQTVFGGYGRWAPLEGYTRFPDVVLQLGYAGYIGNEELSVGATDASLTTGYSIPIGQLLGIHTGTISLYGGVGYLRINATPRLNAELLEELAIGAISGSKNSSVYTEGFAPFTFHGGTEIRSGDVQVLLNITVAPSALVTLNTGFGFVF